MNRIGGKINRTPVRSPSPDIANRNIITRTHSPINEALSKSKHKQSTKTPIGLSFPNIQQLLDALKALQQKHKLLQKDYNMIKQQNYRLIRQTEILHYQNNKLQRQKQYSSSVIIQSNRTDTADYKREYEEKISQMLIQLKRIQEKLNFQIEKNKLLFLQNQKYKDQLDKVKLIKSIHPDDNLKKKMEQCENHFKKMMNVEIKVHQLKLKEYLQQLERRQNKIQYNHSIIQVSINKGKNSTPQRSKRQLGYEGSTAHRSTISYGGRYEKRKGSEELQKQNEQLNRKIKFLSKEVDRIIKQNEDMKDYINEKNNQVDQAHYCSNCLKLNAKILQLQQEINRIKIIEKTQPSHQQLSNHSYERHEVKKLPYQLLNSYLKELQQIKNILTNEEITSYISTIQQNLKEIYSIEQKIEFVKNEKEKMMQDLKAKLMIKDMEILEIKRENQDMKIQIKQLLDENQCIKQLIESRKSMEYQSYHKNNYGKEDNSKLKKYLEEAINKINHLENQISLTLKT